MVDNSDELHLQLVEMHKHIWSTLQHQAADRRYNLWKWSAEIETLDNKIRLNLKRNNHAGAKKFAEEKANYAGMVEHGSKHLAACYEQTDAIDGGTAKSFLILAERGMPQEHPFLETQLEIMNRHQELLAEEQAIVVNDSTNCCAISLLEQSSALEQLRVCLAGAEGGDGTGALLLASAVTPPLGGCWAQIRTNAGLQEGQVTGIMQGGEAHGRVVDIQLPQVQLTLAANALTAGLLSGL